MAAKLTDKDRETILALAARMTGSHQKGEYRREILVQNVESRIEELGAASLAAYLNFACRDKDEFARLLSALTIHTTSWFREAPHFDRFLEHADASQGLLPDGKLRVLSVGCSSGEEVFSLALALESRRELRGECEYEIEGWDIDPVSISKGERAIYQQDALGQIPRRYLKHIFLGSGRTAAYFAPAPEIRQRCRFAVRNVALSPCGELEWDVIFCRNLLIYFSPEQVRRIVKNFANALRPGGCLFLGHSEAVNASEFGLVGKGRATYGKAREGELPEAEAGSMGSKSAPGTLSEQRSSYGPDLILLGASTGGTEALMRLLANLPRPTPPVVVVQHITPAFAKAFAERLASASKLALGRLEGECKLQANTLYMSFGDYHIGLRPAGTETFLTTSHVSALNGHRPSIDFLFCSAAKLKKKVLAALLTGMGDDGAKGMKELRRMGALTIAQDEASSVVFGMPKEAMSLGAVEYMGNIEALRRVLLQAIHATQARMSA